MSSAPTPTPLRNGLSAHIAHKLRLGITSSVQRLAATLHTSVQRVKAIGAIALVSTGAGFIRLGEYLVAMLLWIIASIAITATIWPSAQRRYAGLLRMGACLVGFIFLAFLGTWTVAKKGDDPWTNFIRLVHKRAAPVVQVSTPAEQQHTSSSTTNTVVAKPIPPQSPQRQPERWPAFIQLSQIAVQPAHSVIEPNRSLAFTFTYENKGMRPLHDVFMTEQLYLDKDTGATERTLQQKFAAHLHDLEGYRRRDHLRGADAGVGEKLTRDFKTRVLSEADAQDFLSRQRVLFVRIRVVWLDDTQKPGSADYCMQLEQPSTPELRTDAMHWTQCTYK